MAKTKFYAVKKGNNEGIYTTWDECKKQVLGYKGAIYKSFSTYKEAQDFLNGVDHLEQVVCDCENKAIAYVDGSYNEVTNEFSYGAVIFYKSQQYEFSEKFDNENSSMRNVAGEIEGAKMAMQFCIDNDIKGIDIYYDYQGIQNWAEGLWKTNKLATKEYKQYYDNISKSVRVNFVKVAAHTNNKYNDLADKLAKKALGI